MDFKEYIEKIGNDKINEGLKSIPKLDKILTKYSDRPAEAIGSLIIAIEKEYFTDKKAKSNILNVLNKAYEKVRVINAMSKLSLDKK